MKSNALKQQRQKTGITTNTLVRAALFTAISILLKLIFEIYIPLAGLPALRINLTSIPIILSGIICGPLIGLITGALSDILCFVIKPAGPFFPGFTLTSALTGLIPGLIYKYFKKDRNFNIINTIFVLMISGGCLSIMFNREPLNIMYMVIFITLVALYIYIPAKVAKTEGRNMKMDKILFAVSVTQLITSIILNTYFLSVLFGKGFLVFLPGRIFSNFILIPLYSIIIAAILKIDQSILTKTNYGGNYGIQK